MKKVYNSLGIILVTAYILILVAMVIVGLIFNNEASYYYTVIMSWLAVMTILIPITLHKTLYFILPNQYVKAKVIYKNIFERSTTISSTTELCLTFKCIDNTQKTFGVGNKAFNSVNINEEGTLVYRNHGKRYYFVNLER